MVELDLLWCGILWSSGPVGIVNRAVTASWQNRARELLEEERQREHRCLARLTGDFDNVVAASRDTNADDNHDPEGATIAFERSQVAALVTQAQGHLAEVEAVIQRLNADTYGTCERCGQPIAKARLEVRPAARTCIRCASDPR